MKIAIHQRKGSFSDRWLEYVQEKRIEHKIVNCYDSDIIDQLKDCEGLLWHFAHYNYRDMLFARQLLYSLQISGKKVFPDFNTCWHFDDKVGQKYFLEALSAPLATSHVFYDKTDALKWINNAEFPKVFKLRSGAGSSNVRLVRTRRQAIRLTHKAFGRGFLPYNPLENLRERYRRVKEGTAAFPEILKGVGRLIIAPELNKVAAREKGYVYFQDLASNCNYDIRIIVIGDRAFGIKRIVRKNDFRASGSGTVLYAKEEIDERCVNIAFRLNEIIKSQCIAFDCVIGEDNVPRILEMSYGFSAPAYHSCPGYWDKKMVWHDGPFIPQDWMIDNLIHSLRS